MPLRGARPETEMPVAVERVFMLICSHCNHFSNIRVTLPYPLSRPGIVNRRSLSCRQPTDSRGQLTNRPSLVALTIRVSLPPFQTLKSAPAALADGGQLSHQVSL